MAKTTKTRMKSATQSAIYQSRDEVQTAIKIIGDKQRELQRLATAMNDELAAISASYAQHIDALKEDIKPMQKGVQMWCEVHRNELTDNGKCKTGSFVTGEVQWRIKPPSVSVRNAESVIELLENFGLHQFIRTKQEVNKEAVLADPQAVSAIEGINIKSGEEEFIIKPFEQEVK
ncbi:host-nuclease inhibitor Gam family protein [Mannheimia haemolytica]|uniref:host-nuclease inhibitor Gam family protein n=1 Tax=Mannheimia haemolytica TaxID=75985 RepID=UPI0001BCF7F6|nr:host-nuclease inhibitor Gam family protein [Mannheimia haemolytica]EEY08710.1 inorganic polyphosphate/ATP-NAD kinase [Mannheimia haemolytica serotype A2 str. OVINE]EEY13340.1 inorganic polyphosphate/ATP-NAD kinase [Mannheimia haemolytica serotype A2 str. BOVINE]MDW0723560.1 host-nuclease inhibitor Gam family protein [Mannheimia haemolytica]MDW0736591.1 host-nuclease inhibitor Gam family protein [Mannheimia haemolytica]TRC15179.1 host-nuclease inhibitor protein Gam [Mannheimia haemolytica]